MTIHVLTRKDAKAGKVREERGYQFPLPWTAGVYAEDDAPLDDKGKPDRSKVGEARAVARVKRIPLANLASIAGLTSEMQDTVLEVFRMLREGKGYDFETWAEITRNQERQRELANGLVMLGFIEPRVVGSEAEADALGEGAVWVEEVDIRDRLAYLSHVVQPNGEAAKSMRPFPDAGLRRADAPEGRPAPEPAIEPAGDAADRIRPIHLSAV